MKSRRWMKPVTILLALAVSALVLVGLYRTTSLGEANTWQRMASPGELSRAHAFLESNCAACHAAGRGPVAENCIACHATSEVLLQRQPTRFHAHVGSCRECHPEHQGSERRPSTMDHLALARIGLRKLKEGEEGSESNDLYKELTAWLTRQEDANGHAAGVARITAHEATLNCASCHGNQDRHFRLFGQDCAQCHSTTKWTILGYRHPSPRSTDCAQCHQAPPSHLMEHFHMVSMKVAGKPHARVNQCFLCHETTSWNDIKGIGWYKHH